MSQQTTYLSLDCLTKRTPADHFLDEMNRVVPWVELAAVVAPHYQPAGTGRPLTEVELLLRLHCLQLWYIGTISEQRCATIERSPPESAI